MAVIGGGLVLGTVFGALIARWAIGNHVRSPEFWHELSLRTGLGLSAASTELSFLPPVFSVTGLEVKQGSQKILSAANAQVSVSLSKLATLVGAVDVLAGEVQVYSDNDKGKAQAEEPLRPFSLDVPLPLRRLELSAYLKSVKLSESYLPQSDVELVAVAERNEDGAIVKIEAVKALGITASGALKLGRGENSFEFDFPAEASVVSGKLTGAWAPKFFAKGDLRLPGATLAIPPEAHWLVGGKPLEIAGRAKLVGNAEFQFASESQWQGRGQFDVDLTEAAVVSDTFEKKAGVRAAARAAFEGDAAKSWSLRELSLKLGALDALLNVESVKGGHTRVAGRLEPFEISEFVPIVLKGTKGSGRAQALFDLSLGDHHALKPTGMVDLTLEKVVLDGRALLRTFEVSEAISLQGPLKIDAAIKASLKSGAFKSGSAKALVDFSDTQLQYENTFKKRIQYPMIVDLDASATGQKIDVQALRLVSGEGIKLWLKGKIHDLQSGRAQLELVDSRLTLSELSRLMPGVGDAQGLLRIHGTIQGALLEREELFAKLESVFKGLSVEHKSLSVQRGAGKLELIVSRTELGELGFLARTPGVSALVDPKIKDFRPVLLRAEGKVGLQDRALTGALSASTGVLDLAPLLTATQIQERPPNTDQPGSLIDYDRSELNLSVSSPLIAVPYVEFRDAKAEVKIGAAGVKGAPIVSARRIGGQALGGEVRLKGALSGAVATVSASGDGLSMPDVMQLIARVSEKQPGAAVFGRGDIQIEGQATLGEALNGVELSGEAQIREGGFKFLPAPKSFLDRLRNVPVIADKLPTDGESGQITDTFEKATAKFKLRSERIDLEVDVSDPFVSLRSAGFVTVGGHCEMTGQITPREKLVGARALPYFESGGIPFESTGDDWQCKIEPKLEALVARAVRDKATDTVKDFVRKGLFGK